MDAGTSSAKTRLALMPGHDEVLTVPVNFKSKRASALCQYAFARFDPHEPARWRNNPWLQRGLRVITEAAAAIANS